MPVIIIIVYCLLPSHAALATDSLFHYPPGKCGSVSFGNLLKWLQEAKTFPGNTATYMLVGNKSYRMDRIITSEQGEQFAKRLDVPFTKTSAKVSHNVNGLFLASGLVIKILIWCYVVFMTWNYFLFGTAD